MINVEEGYTGHITIIGGASDSETETVTINLPEGYTLQRSGYSEDPSEDPAAQTMELVVLDENGVATGGRITITNINVVEGDIVCFTSGTLIDTPNGPRPVETLRPGDLVDTLDHGIQPLRWLGMRRLSAADLALSPHLRPIRIRAGALGPGKPSADLLVSPQHRVLVRSAIARRMFGTDEVLIAAKHVLQVEGIDIATDLADVTYIHLLFDQHEIVLSNGAETESFYTGPEAMKAVGAEARAEILELFPDLELASARPLIAGRKGRQMITRHIRNRQHLVGDAFQ